MNIQSFADVDVKNKESLQEFLDLNSMAHETIYDMILAGGKVSEHYPLFTDEMSNDWLQIHAQAHKDESIAMGLQPVIGLDNLDIQNEEMLADWLNNHYLDHEYKAQVLGL